MITASLSLYDIGYSFLDRLFLPSRPQSGTFSVASAQLMSFETHIPDPHECWVRCQRTDYSEPSLLGCSCLAWAVTLDKRDGRSVASG